MWLKLAKIDPHALGHTKSVTVFLFQAIWVNKSLSMMCSVDVSKIIVTDYQLLIKKNSKKIQKKFKFFFNLPGTW
jgi:hypothetical protein